MAWVLKSFLLKHLGKQSPQRREEKTGGSVLQPHHRWGGPSSVTLPPRSHLPRGLLTAGRVGGLSQCLMVLCMSTQSILLLLQERFTSRGQKNTVKPAAGDPGRPGPWDWLHLQGPHILQFVQCCQKTKPRLFYENPKKVSLIGATLYPHTDVS